MSRPPVGYELGLTLDLAPSPPAASDEGAMLPSVDVFEKMLDQLRRETWNAAIFAVLNSSTMGLFPPQRQELVQLLISHSC